MRSLLWFAFLTLAGVTSVAQGAQPRTMSYQGSLRDAQGAGVPDGNYELTFRLWDAVSGGQELWQEVDTVAVSGTVFNAMLGKNNPLTLDFNNRYWLGISVGSNPELAPRVEMAASPYSLHSAIADSLNGGMPGERGCSVVGTSIVIPNGNTLVAFQTEEWDTGEFHDNNTNPSRLTAPVAGKYLVSGYLNWSDQAGGSRYTGVGVNGSTSWLVVQGGGMTSNICGNVTMPVYLHVGDYVELLAGQWTGSDKTLAKARFAIIFLGK